MGTDSISTVHAETGALQTLVACQFCRGMSVAQAGPLQGWIAYAAMPDPLGSVQIMVMAREWRGPDSGRRRDWGEPGVSRVSPDGTRLAWVAGAGPIPGASLAVWIADADGSNPIEHPVEEPPEGLVWSPDGGQNLPSSIRAAAFNCSSWTQTRGASSRSIPSSPRSAVRGFCLRRGDTLIGVLAG